MKWLAPAKINLSLRVLGRREDGFHEIETLMAPLTLADEIEIAADSFAPAPRVDLTCDDASLPTGKGNLAYRAAALFQERARTPMPAVRIHLHKKVPHGAGLGGGSSDAASVLLALNELCDSPFTGSQLAQLASELGSDIPFFVYRSAAICRGRGERVEPVAFDVELPLLLVKPAFPIPTPWAYGRWSDSRELPGVRYSPQIFPWGELVNDLERPVFEKYVVLAEMKTWLLAQPEVAGALLSGSGSTMIALLHHPGPDAKSLVERVTREFGGVWTCVCATAPVSSRRTSTFLTTPELPL